MCNAISLLIQTDGHIARYCDHLDTHAWAGCH